jgi:Zinc-binding dehydrogenase
VLGGPEPHAYGREDLTVTYVRLTAEPGDLVGLGERATNGRCLVEIGGLYPFDQVAQALVDLARKHTRGKLVVTVRRAGVFSLTARSR